MKDKKGDRPPSSSLLTAHLSTGLLRKHPEPVAYHGEDGGEVGQTKHDPGQNQELEILAIMTITWTQRKLEIREVFFILSVMFPILLENIDFTTLIPTGH